MTNDKFHFTITDAARFLGKSPVTLRQWERKGLVQFPRYNGLASDRRFSACEIRKLAYQAHELKRIGRARLHLVIAAIELIEQIERTNDENRIGRSTRSGKKSDR